MQEKEINLLYYLNVINKWKKIIAIFMAITIVLAVILALSEPKVYVAIATFLIPAEQTAISGSNFRNILGQSGFGGFSLRGAGGDITKLIDAIVKSRRMAKAIAEEFDLQKRYGIDYENAITKANGMVRTYYLPNGATMAVEAKSESPQFSADLANFTVAYIDKINQELEVTSMRPIAKVLDPAVVSPLPQPRQIKKKAFIAFFASGLFGSIAAFFAEYIKRLKEESK